MTEQEKIKTELETRNKIARETMEEKKCNQII